MHFMQIVQKGEETSCIVSRPTSNRLRNTIRINSNINTVYCINFILIAKGLVAILTLINFDSRRTERERGEGDD